MRLGSNALHEVMHFQYLMTKDHMLEILLIPVIATVAVLYNSSRGR